MLLLGVPVGANEARATIIRLLPLPLVHARFNEDELAVVTVNALALLVGPGHVEVTKTLFDGLLEPQAFTATTLYTYCVSVMSEEIVSGEVALVKGDPAIGVIDSVRMSKLSIHGLAAALLEMRIRNGPVIPDAGKPTLVWVVVEYEIVPKVVMVEKPAPCSMAMVS